MTNLNATMTQMNTKIDDMSDNLISQMTLTNTGQAVSLTGKTVTVQTTDTSGNVTTNSGTVDSIKFVNGVAKLVINGVEYDTSSVTEVAA